MGWDFTRGATRRDIMDRLCKAWGEGETATHMVRRAAVGNTLYVVHETTGRKWVGVYLLGKDRGFGWGYKDMTESMGPAQASCPPSLYADVPLPEGRAGLVDCAARCDKNPFGDDGCKCGACHGCSRCYASNWRERCATYARLRSCVFQLKMGDRIRLRQGYSVKGELEVYSTRPLMARTQDGRLYRVPVKAVAEVVS